MTFLGKVLVFLQVIMSLLFMCAAGAVYSLHTNWKTQATTLKDQAAAAQTAHAEEVATLNKQLTDKTAEVAAQSNRADAELSQRQQLDRQVASLTQETNTLNQQLQRQTALAEAKAKEADFRQTEAEQMRVQNETQQRTLDQQVDLNRQQADRIRSMELAHEELLTAHDELVAENSLIKKVLQLNGLEADPRAVAGVLEPPPALDGLVVDARKDRTNRVKTVQISLGSDDGLKVGHEMDVYRPADAAAGTQSKYLGRIRITYVEADQAVGTVVTAAKNGIIERGDNVTTNL